MKYLSFDIEAANGYQLSSICSIGIVVADEQFNIVSRENVWINPKTRYNLNGTRENVGIDLHLDKKLLRSSPDFRAVFGKIRDYLTNGEYFVFGHAVDADVRMLNAACVRYKLPCIEFEFADSQLLYKLYKGEKDVKALHKIAAEIGVEYVEHNSEEDAYATMLTLKYLTEQSGMSAEELMRKYRVRKGANRNFVLTRPVSLDGQTSKKHVVKTAWENVKKYADKVKKKSNLFKNAAFSLSRSLELGDEQTLHKAIDVIVSNGGRYVTKLAKANVYVYGTTACEQDACREKRVDELAAQGLIVKLHVNKLTEEKRMDALTFLHKHGQSAEQVNVAKSMEIFAEEMHKGLRGKCDAIPMIPTYLTDVDRSKIKPNVKRILIDAGGTNFRVGLGYFDAQGKPHVEDVQKTVMPASDGVLHTKEQFYSVIASNVAPFLDKAGGVGFCFSYQVNMHPDVDGEVVMFSKEINAPGVIGTKVGAETLSALRKYSDKQRKIVVLNDTVATLLGGMATADKRYSGYVGYIYGTGTNACYVEDTCAILKVDGLPSGKMIVNTECGNFDGFVRGDFDRECIAKTAVPNRQLFEKMTSGKYLADIIACAYRTAVKEKRFEKEVTLFPFELKDVSSLLAESEFPCKFQSERDLHFAQDVAFELVERAAKMGAIAVSSLAIASCGDKRLPVAVVAEGTTFNKLTGYRAAFEKYLSEILSAHGIAYEIVQGQDLNLVGSLMATMIF